DLASTGYCLAKTGAEYLVYQPQGDSKEFSVKLESGRYTVEWTDLTSGRVVTARDLQAAAGENTFAPPTESPAILRLKK
ncbi:MAG: putative collagen-binding domain-containing protein, partial [Planctomycetota bacterium]